MQDNRHSEERSDVGISCSMNGCSTLILEEIATGLTALAMTKNWRVRCEGSEKKVENFKFP